MQQLYSMFMQLISAPESNKHEKNKPSSVNFECRTLCHALVDSEHLRDIFAINPNNHWGCTLQVVNQHLLPEFLGVGSLITCVKAASYNCSWNFEKIAEVITFYCIDGLCAV